ncbi:hypothetical protein G6L97_04270 [Agrobacterium tumefaciens]|uniref:hypothetical protein n=1 Tax=Agrobacterium tumefaciens TaxID=358 RepID=UPI00122FFE8E|nr:hypothetical protein [Agrobacterium tumefaciens]NSZ83626.1 hypothetical protein [Agrobacterium tumefaciens]WCA69835.1 hypothetical protein G6L97_04270 [Agrobacterium tumefaciens]
MLATKPKKTPVTVYLTPDVAHHVAMVAINERRSYSAAIEKILADHMASHPSTSASEASHG